MGVAKAIEYNFKGEDKQMVELTLDKGAQVVGNAKDIMYIEEGINLGNVEHKTQGHLGLLTKRLKSMDSVDTRIEQEVASFTNDDKVQRTISFGSPYVGKIVAIELSRGRSVVYCLSQAFLCAGEGASIEISPVRKNDLICKECIPYVMEKITGEGTVFLSSNGTVICRKLAEGEVLRIDVGCLLAITKEIQYDYQVIGSNGSEDFVCLATVLGPGHVWLQSTSFNQK